MKVVHLCLGCFFPDNYSYQENMLPKYHKELGYEVEVIASLFTFDKNGKDTYLQSGSTYKNEYNIQVTRLNYKKPVKIYRKFKRYMGTYEALEKANPDILFIHGCQFMDVDVVVKYLKLKPAVRVFVDNHADFSNSATNFISKNILHKIIWKHFAHLINPYTLKFYGVLPARAEFLKDVYNLPKEKVEVLVMGADDDQVKEAIKPDIKHKIREKYGIDEKDFLVITGGKIDAHKTQTLLLMSAIAKIDSDKVKLIVFGSITPELEENVKALCCGKKVQYIGWIPSEQSYSYFAASDLVVFPGRHSVFWEQVAGLGIPMLCKYWEGTTHIDFGGNLKYLKEDSEKEIQDAIEELVNDDQKYAKMKTVAVNEGMKNFSYRDIAKRSIRM